MNCPPANPRQLIKQFPFGTREKRTALPRIPAGHGGISARRRGDRDSAFCAGFGSPCVKGNLPRPTGPTAERSLVSDRTQMVAVEVNYSPVVAVAEPSSARRCLREDATWIGRGFRDCCQDCLSCGLLLPCFGEHLPHFIQGFFDLTGTSSGVGTHDPCLKVVRL